ncbi:ABC transporter substrate-binding protein [Actinomadura alba]|uniref:ABC transporter substrate-binding protein n=1 Tax=Actinomadura alba TaxID=406431 RepID=UPI001C9D116C|nr:ABC transporter substrate-binding protein [Actinomadura alba]
MTVPVVTSQISARQPLSRRSLLRSGLTAGVAGALAPLVSACGGFGTSGGGSGKLVFLSTQFNPIEEGQRFREILTKAGVDTQYVPMDTGPFAARLNAELQAGKPTVNVIGGLYGQLAPFAPGRLEDLSDVAARLSGRGYDREVLDLAKFGTDRTYFIPWMQATFILAASKKALEHLPSGADVNKLTYDQLLAWAKAARSANGKPVFGLPAGPKGLLHRFLEGYLYPSFTGGQITTFRSDDAVRMWEYLRELWSVTVRASTNFEFMQEPLASGQVQIAWDHVARLTEAPTNTPDGFVMVPAPSGPKGRGYMPVVAGLAIPKGAPRQDEAKKLIEALSRPDIQVDVLRKNAFFPAVKASIPADLPPGIRLEAGAVTAQQGASDALLSLAPVGMGARDGELDTVFKNAFTRIVLDGEDIRRTLDRQAKELQRLLDEAKAPCWRPDAAVAGQQCKVA